MTSDFEVGDVVRLKSAGPWMTVVAQLGDDVVKVCWFAHGHADTGGFLAWQGPFFAEFNAAFLVRRTT